MNSITRFALGSSLFLVAACAGTEHASEASTPALTTHHLATLPVQIGSGENKQVDLWLDEGPLRLVTIVLRDGTILPPHTAPVPVTIHVLDGRGVIHLGTEAVVVERGSVLLLPAGAEHDVVPDPGTDLRVLVHYMRGATAAHAN